MVICCCCGNACGTPFEMYFQSIRVRCRYLVWCSLYKTLWGFCWFRGSGYRGKKTNVSQSKEEARIPGGLQVQREKIQAWLPSSRKTNQDTISWCICRLLEYAAKHTTTTGARCALCVLLHIWIVCIYKRKWSTPNMFLFFLGASPVMVRVEREKPYVSASMEGT